MAVSKSVGRPTVLPSYVEKLLVSYCLKMEANFYGLTYNDLTRMAYQLAFLNRISHPFQNEKAGRKWRRLFFRRHPELSMRKPEKLSLV